MSETVYPTMMPPSDQCGAVITLAILERSLQRMRDPEEIRKRQEFQAAQHKAAIEYVERRYANYLGVESLSAKQREELYDGMAEAWWRRMTRTTNIVEWLSE